ncbi:MAG: PilZ domain-containing protein, partial [Thermodesulfovibrionales bacterium]|nr:PilZ domain-containing protein [Thermodesulfovibrionales bacterium]
SEGGVFVRSIEPLVVGSEVEVSIEMMEGKSLHLTGIVIYQKDVYTNAFKFASGMAIEFKNLTAKTSEILKDYILNLLVGDIMEEQKNIFKLK